MMKSYEVLRGLERNGYRRVSQNGSHIKMRDDKGHIVIVPEHKGKDLSIGVIMSILRAAGLTLDDLRKA